MEFKENRGIYLQIADDLCNQILGGGLKPNDRVPSVRDLAVNLEVNRNTVMRSYQHLQDQGIFDNKRGIGFFVAEHAIEKIKEKEKKYFFENDLPLILQKVNLLKLNSKELKTLLQEINKND
jgi:DNA-binding transcriptional regulator YhcF (GntR family)